MFSSGYCCHPLQLRYASGSGLGLGIYITWGNNHSLLQLKLRYNNILLYTSGLVLVTDAIPAMGLGVGIHHMGQQTIEIRKDGHAVVAGTDTLCGR